MTRNSPEADDSRANTNLNSDPPDDDFEELQTQQTQRDINLGSENSEDEEAQDQNGYELLPASAEDIADDEEEDVIEFGYSNWDGENFQTTTSRDFTDLIQTLPATQSSGPLDCSANIPLNTDQIEEIKSIMSNINLPGAAVPTWANSMTDDELKKVVDEKIAEKN